MARPKILFITPQHFFLERGSPYRVRAEVLAIVSQGYDVHLLSYPFGRALPLAGVTHYRSPGVPGIRQVPIGWSWRKLLLDLMLFFKTLQLLMFNRYALVHGVEDAGVIAAVLTRVFRVPYIFDMHSQMTEQLSQCVIRAGSFPHRLMCRFERWCMRRAAGIITVSDVITARVRVIAPEVPAMTLEDLALGAEAPDPALVAALREKYRTDNYRVAVYTGNFEPYQGIDLLLTAYAQMLTVSNVLSRPPLLILVGGGNPDDPRMRQYRKLAETLGIGERIVFAGQQSEESMGAFMELAEVLVSPRIAGAHTPLKIYTYMAAAKPIVATQIAAHTNVLSDQNAFLALATAEHFAETLCMALGEDESARQLREERVIRAADLLQKRFSRTEFERRVGVLYRAARGEQLSDEVLLSPELLELRQRQQSWG